MTNTNRRIKYNVFPKGDAILKMCIEYSIINSVSGAFKTVLYIMSLIQYMYIVIYVSKYYDVATKSVVYETGNIKDFITVVTFKLFKQLIKEKHELWEINLVYFSSLCAVNYYINKEI